MLRKLVFMAVLCLIAATAAAELRGRSLAEALHILEGRGLRIIYSTDVVRPEMIVGIEPRSTEPRQLLDELLREHRLHATSGPHGSIVIVRDAEKPAPRAAKAKPPQMPVTLESIVVTPSQFTIFTSEPENHQFLSRDEVRTVPHLGDDVYRAFDRLPGITGLDVSARFNIRGGQEDETQVLMDGAEIYDPFHVRDLFRAFSTIDAESIGAVDVLTGGFPLQYGGRLSGVIDISSLKPTSRRHTEIGIGILNERILTDGTFQDGRSEYLVSFRRGYLRELLKLIDPQNKTINPAYYDLRGRLETTLNDRAIVSGDVFVAGDTLKVNEPGGLAHGSYSDRYSWVNLRNALSPKLFTQTVASTGRIATHRVGSYGAPFDEEEGAVDDDHAFEFVALRNDSSIDLSERNVFKAGFAVKKVRARYDYEGHAIIRASFFHVNDGIQTIDRAASVRADGNDLAVYAADRIAVTPHMVVEAGARVDAQSYTPDGTHVAPRINVAYSLGAHAMLRASWGRFYQAQGINELQVEDGVTNFLPAERADHAVLGAEYDFGRGYSARAEGYDKRFTQLRPRFENIFDRVVIYPEMQPDRLRIDASSGRARGGELLFRKVGTPISGWISYARASAHDVLDGVPGSAGVSPAGWAGASQASTAGGTPALPVTVPRSWDQRDTATFNLDYRLGARWNFDVAGVYHSGWPTTPVNGVLVSNVFHTVVGAYNSDRLPAYRRVDLRASRNFTTTHGGVSFFVELFNALGIRNVSGVAGYTFNADSNRVITGHRNYEVVFGAVPSFGITYSF
ncbi:MAG TPA: TonB-dependent receptor [Thermoanaerobaculia bacterium]|nr:TonB-dependent receptor [Thermoanaerobaculia bacterium]